MYIVGIICIYSIYILYCTQYVYIHRPKEKCTINHTEGKFTPEYKKKIATCYMNTGLLKHDFQITTSRRLKKLL